MSVGDYERLWATHTPTALGVRLSSGAGASRVGRAIESVLGRGSGLEALTAKRREQDVDELANEGLRQIDQISNILLAAAVLAMAAALASAIWQRRMSLAGLRLAGVRPHRLRLILLSESALMLGAGCATGALAGVAGQIVIDRYLRHVTGFPVATLGASLRPFEVYTFVIATVLAFASIPGWLASRVSPALAFNE
jgi:predicted lysophospholipase L1 biosynthesis ABC-type transport system permease subunit